MGTYGMSAICLFINALHAYKYDIILVKRNVSYFFWLESSLCIIYTFCTLLCYYIVVRLIYMVYFSLLKLAVLVNPW